MLSPATVVLHPGKDRSLRRHHPWVFGGAIASLHGSAHVGDTVRVVAADGSFLAWGLYSPDSQIAVRAWSFREDELIDEALGRVLRSIEARGRGDDVDIVFTTDHGEFQGDFGLLFKGPYHVDSLMRLPMIWRPAASAGWTRWRAGGSGCDRRAGTPRRGPVPCRA